MPGDQLQDRIREQFSYESSRADIWRVFNVVLPTHEFLNFGYSRWYQPYFLGSSQRRLAQEIGRDLTTRLPGTSGRQLLDIGCGRGGPTLYFADALGFDATGIDLVPYNIAVARENAAERGIPAAFIIGDATDLPFKSNSCNVCTALDSIVYVPAKQAAFAEMARVLHGDGIATISDLVVHEGLDDTAISAVTAFAEAWDMPPIIPFSEYRQAIERAGLAELEVQDISSHNIARLRKWTTLYLRLVGDGIGDTIVPFFQRRGLDLPTITSQVRCAHEALPYLRHVTIYARNG